jgi:hypothetical protein
VVHLGFVLNVIEAPDERLETLRDAWSICRKLLIVAARVAGGDRLATGGQYGDGVVTRLGTFLNLERFPADFMFQLTKEEADSLRFQSGISNTRGGRRYAPRVFTEQGVAMLSSVLHSPRAVAVNIEIMRAFVRLRDMLASHADLARRLDELERKYDQQFAVVFQAIRELMKPSTAKPKEMGYHTLVERK